MNNKYDYSAALRATQPAYVFFRHISMEIHLWLLIFAFSEYIKYCEMTTKPKKTSFVSKPWHIEVV